MRPILSRYRPAASYLLREEPIVSGPVVPILVEDSDVGPILTHPSDVAVGHFIRETRTWEPAEGRFLRGLLRPGMNVIDVGANIGYFSLLMAKVVGPNGRVLAVEAEPGNFRYLRANIELSGLENIEALPVAAGAAHGLSAIERDDFNHGGSRLVDDGNFHNACPVELVRLDDVLEPSVPVDMVKIDIEGLDHTAVQGLERTFRQWEPTMLVELNPGLIERVGESPKEVIQLYRDFGFAVHLLGGDLFRLHSQSGMPLEPMLLDNLLVTKENEGELIQRTRRIHFVNLILTPRRAGGAEVGVPSSV